MLPNGYQVALACGPLKKARFINPAIEKELAEFKEEIAEKNAKSEMNRTYVFPRNDVLSTLNPDEPFVLGKFFESSKQRLATNSTVRDRLQTTLSNITSSTGVKNSRQDGGATVNMIRHGVEISTS